MRNTDAIRYRMNKNALFWSTNGKFMCNMRNVLLNIWHAGRKIWRYQSGKSSCNSENVNIMTRRQKINTYLPNTAQKTNNWTKDVYSSNE